MQSRADREREAARERAGHPADTRHTRQWLQGGRGWLSEEQQSQEAEGSQLQASEVSA